RRRSGSPPLQSTSSGRSRLQSRPSLPRYSPLANIWGRAIVPASALRRLPDYRTMRPPTSELADMLDFLKQDQDPLTGKVMRKVRSFVLREGRLTAGQQKALDALWPRFGLERAAGVLDAQQVFGRDAPRV